MAQLMILDEKQFQEIQEDIKLIKKALESQGKLSSPKKWLTTQGASELLNVKPRTCYHYCQIGRLTPRKVGGILLFDRFEIEALIEGK
jgi:hypothetical protein